MNSRGDELINGKKPLHQIKMRINHGLNCTMKLIYQGVRLKNIVLATIYFSLSYGYGYL